jgi:hypothetical protein
MEPEGLLPCSQGPSTGPYPEPEQSSPYQSLKNHKVHKRKQAKNTIL